MGNLWKVKDFKVILNNQELEGEQAIEFLQKLLNLPAENFELKDTQVKQLKDMVAKIKANIDKILEDKELLESLDLNDVGGNKEELRGKIENFLDERLEGVVTGKSLQDRVLGILFIGELAQKVVRGDFKAVEKVSEEPKLTKDALLLSLMNAIDNPLTKVTIGRGKKKTKFATNLTEGLGLKREDKVIILSLFYGLTFYACNGYKEIRLTDLMEQTGFQKEMWKGESHGFSSENKKKAVNALKFISIMEIRSEPIDGQVPYFIKRLFNDAVAGDRMVITPFAISFDLLEDRDGKVKDGIVKFSPNFNPEAVYFFKPDEIKILKLPNKETVFKLFCLFIARRKAFLSQNKINSTVVKVKELLDMCQVPIDRTHPQRVREELEEALSKARREGIIKHYNLLLDGKLYSDVYERNYGWFDAWLGSEMGVGF